MTLLKTFSLNLLKIMKIFNTLLKKQFSEMLSVFFPVKKNTQKRSTAQLAIYTVLMVYVVAVFIGLFFIYANFLCEPFCSAGLAWLYFSIMGLTALAISLIGTVFITYIMIYKAGDNDQLLSMPLPAGYILLSRIISVYFMAFFMTAMVMLPAAVVWIISGRFTILSVLLSVVSIFIIPLLSVALSCLLAWVIALLMSKTTHKTLITVIFSMLFLGVYFIGYSKIYEAMSFIATNGESIGKQLKLFAYPFYCMGYGTAEKAQYYLIFAALCILAFSLVYLILSKTFLSLSTAKKGEKKRSAVKTENLKSSGLQIALFKKEARRFFSSSAYILNGGMGCIILLVLPVFAAIYKSKINEMTAQINITLTPILGAFVCFILSTVIISASSVSIEGKSIWIIKSLPLSAKDVLTAKLMFHIVAAGISALVSCVAFGVIFQIGAVDIVVLLLLGFSYVVLTAAFGLAMNLHFPALDWKSEVVAVKQGASVMISIFTSMIIAIVPVIVYTFIGNLLSYVWFLLLVTAVFAVISAALIGYIFSNGIRIFENLN